MISFPSDPLCNKSVQLITTAFVETVLFPENNYGRQVFILFCRTYYLCDRYASRKALKKQIFCARNLKPIRLVLMELWYSSSFIIFTMLKINSNHLKYFQFEHWDKHSQFVQLKKKQGANITVIAFFFQENVTMFLFH